jgi:O-antigen/teichoic acid export membrane protein
MSLNIQYLLFNLLSKFLVGLTGIFIARFYGPEDFGLFSATYALVMLLVTFINFGQIENLITNFFKHQSDNLIQETLKSLILLTLIFLIFVLIVSEEFFIYMFIWGLFFRIGTQLNVAVLQINNLIMGTSIIQLFNGIIYFINILIAYQLQFTLTGFIYLNMIAFIIFFCIVFFYSKYKIKFSLDYKAPDFTYTLKNSYRYGISGFLAYIYMSSDIVMIKYLIGYNSAGIYAAASTIVIFLYFIPDLFYRFYLSSFDKLKQEKKSITKQLGNFYNLNIFIIVTAVLIFIMFSKEIIQIIYTQEYIEASKFLFAYAFILLIHSFCFMPGLLLTVNNMQKEKNKIQLQVALINIILNFIFISKFGAIGAIYATIISELYLLVSYMRLSREEIFKLSFKSLQKSIVSIIVLGIVFIFIDTLSFSTTLALQLASVTLIIFYLINLKEIKRALHEY